MDSLFSVEYLSQTVIGIEEMHNQQTSSARFYISIYTPHALAVVKLGESVTESTRSFIRPVKSWEQRLL